MNNNYFHSVRLDKEKCKGCTNCIKRCPTEAIRVRDGKAKIMDERCIDCGECIRICPYHAKKAVTDDLKALDKYKYNIALPAPTLYGQFKGLTDINYVLSALLSLGFDDVYEVAWAADIVSAKIRSLIKDKKGKKPYISSACPAIVRLIQVRFPNLIDNIIDVQSPMEVAGLLARKEAAGKYSLDDKDIGVFFITPCAAKMTSIKNPVGMAKSYVNGAIAIPSVYGMLSSTMKKENVKKLQRSTAYGIGWANSGGESNALGVENYLAVDGIQNVIKVLDEIENNKLNDLDFFEGLACTGGCVGGPLTVENGFVAKNRIKRLVKNNEKVRLSQHQLDDVCKDIAIHYSEEILPKSIMKLDDDVAKAIEKMNLIDKIYDDLPGLDCGSCGSPSCKTLAEDIVRGYASEMDCIFKLREKVKGLAQQMIELYNKIPTGKER
ncbi:MAG TPA: 4Fe-4S binding protein [Clostridiales bacterium]|nr:4Fe-4S binding protein [Clostridiales bacterium]